MHLGALLVSKQVWHLMAKYYNYIVMSKHFSPLEFLNKAIVK